MTELRARMIHEMSLRRFSPKTHKAYLGQMIGLVRHFRRPPDQISNEEVRQYLGWLLLERKLSWSSCNQAAQALRFFYTSVLDRPAAELVLPAARAPQKLPEILSREEVCRLLRAPANPKHRLLLATVYSAGLRVSEAVHLRVEDIDSHRRTIRIEQGKGAKDRYVPLSERLLRQMRQYWKDHPPGVWLFANRAGSRPIDITVAQRVWGAAKLKAGIKKSGGIHSLRHAFATHLIESGTDVHTVQRLLGHRFITSTMRYFHLSRGVIASTRSPLDLPDPTSE